MDCAFIGVICGFRPVDASLSLTHFSISDFLKRQAVRIFPAGISPFWAQS
jgi:hypothetical protein